MGTVETIEKANASFVFNTIVEYDEEEEAEEEVNANLTRVITPDPNKDGFVFPNMSGMVKEERPKRVQPKYGDEYAKNMEKIIGFESKKKETILKESELKNEWLLSMQTMNLLLIKRKEMEQINAEKNDDVHIDIATEEEILCMIMNDKI